MKVKELLTGIKVMLSTHPEALGWDVYNVEAHCRGVCFAFAPTNYDVGYGPGRIPDFARADLWEQQRWYYAANGLEPDEWLKKQWEEEELKEGRIRALLGRFKDDVPFYNQDRSGNMAIERGMTVCDIDKAFISHMSGTHILIRIEYDSNESVVGYPLRYIYGPFWSIVMEARMTCRQDPLNEQTLANMKSYIEDSLKWFDRSKTENENGWSSNGFAELTGLETIDVEMHGAEPRQYIVATFKV